MDSADIFEGLPKINSVLHEFDDGMVELAESHVLAQYTKHLYIRFSEKIL